MMKNIIKHSQLTLIVKLGGVAYWSQFNAMPASINSDREPGGGLS